MKLRSIRISNILSFEYREKIEDAEEINFDENLNILIGPNGAGKSNFLEIINQLFRNIMVLGCNFNEANIEENRKEPHNHPLNGTITQQERRHTLVKNNDSNSNIKRILIEIELGPNDIQNLLFLHKNKSEINRLFAKYCNVSPQFKSAVTEQDLQSKTTVSFMFEDSGNQKKFNLANTSDETTRFIADYFAYFEFLQNLITIANRFEGMDWMYLKNTFALISGYRNYDKVNPIFPLDPNENAKLQQIRNSAVEDSTRQSKNTEPIVFEFVKHKLSYAYDRIREEIASKSGTEFQINKKAIDLLDNEPVFRNINELLDESLGLKLTIERVPRTSSFSFGFTDRNSKMVQLADLSAGEKGIIHFAFSIYGYDLEKGVMIIDEPELHLHPQIQHRYLSLIDKAVERSQIQFVIATHSPAFVTPKTVGGVRRFYKPDGFTKVVVPTSLVQDEKDLVNILTLTNSSKIFFATKVVLVEGPSDEYFYKVFCNYYCNLNARSDSNIEFLYIGGKNGYLTWKQFLDKFKIQSYFIGDLDNILDVELGITDANTKDKLMQDFENYKKNTPNYQKTKKGNKELLDFIKTNNQAEWNRMKTVIPSRYQHGIFVLQDGDLEDYLGKSSSNKLENVIKFCKTCLENWYSNPVNANRVSELSDIYDQILK